MKDRKKEWNTAREKTWTRWENSEWERMKTLYIKTNENWGVQILTNWSGNSFPFYRADRLLRLIKSYISCSLSSFFFWPPKDGLFLNLQWLILDVLLNFSDRIEKQYRHTYMKKWSKKRRVPAFWICLPVNKVGYRAESLGIFVIPLT